MGKKYTELTRESHPEHYERIEAMVGRVQNDYPGLEMPRIQIGYVSEKLFGKKNAWVSASGTIFMTPELVALSPDLVEGVAAHEVGHYIMKHGAANNIRDHDNAMGQLEKNLPRASTKYAEISVVEEAAIKVFDENPEISRDQLVRAVVREIEASHYYGWPGKISDRILMPNKVDFIFEEYGAVDGELGGFITRLGEVKEEVSQYAFGLMDNARKAADKSKVAECEADHFLVGYASDKGAAMIADKDVMQDRIANQSLGERLGDLFSTHPHDEFRAMLIQNPVLGVLKPGTVVFDSECRFKGTKPAPITPNMKGTGRDSAGWSPDVP